MSSGAGGRKPAKAAAPVAGASAGAMDPEQMPELMFKNLDKNGDGSLSRAEMQNIIDQVSCHVAATWQRHRYWSTAWLLRLLRVSTTTDKQAIRKSAVGRVGRRLLRLPRQERRRLHR